MTRKIQMMMIMTALIAIMTVTIMEIGDANNNLRMMTITAMITMMMTMMTMMIVFQPKLDYFQPCSGQHAFQPLLIQSMRET